MRDLEQTANRANPDRAVPPMVTTHRDKPAYPSRRRNRPEAAGFSVSEFYGCLCHRPATDSSQSEALTYAGRSLETRARNGYP